MDIIHREHFSETLNPTTKSATVYFILFESTY